MNTLAQQSASWYYHVLQTKISELLAAVFLLDHPQDHPSLWRPFSEPLRNLELRNPKLEMDVQQYSETLLGRSVHFYILSMKQSHFVWIGDAPKFSELAVAMKSRYVSAISDLGCSNAVCLDLSLAKQCPFYLPVKPMMSDAWSNICVALIKVVH